AREGHDLDVAPPDALGPAGAQGFENGLLGGEPPGEVLGLTLAALRVGGLGDGEDPLEKAVAVLLEHLRDARGLDEVDAVPEDAHGQLLAFGFLSFGGVAGLS